MPRYCCSNKLTTTDATSINLLFEDEAGQFTLSLPSSHDNCMSVLERITALASPSPFGHNGQTVLDSSIREAKHVYGQHVTVEGFTLESSGILDIIKEALVPDASSVRAELHKLNVYSRGGHFAPHVDTPMGEGFFGSLVLLLPLYHVGGALTVHEPGTSGMYSLLLVGGNFMGRKEDDPTT